MTDTTNSVETLKVLPQFENSPTGRPLRRKFSGAKALYSYAVTNGNRIDLTNQETIQALSAAGLPANNYAAAVHEARKYFGMKIDSVRTGRNVTSLVVHIY